MAISGGSIATTLNVGTLAVAIAPLLAYQRVRRMDIPSTPRHGIACAEAPTAARPTAPVMTAARTMPVDRTCSVASHRADCTPRLRVRRRASSLCGHFAAQLDGAPASPRALGHELVLEALALRRARLAGGRA
jgi:hypothetical protein